MLYMPILCLSTKMSWQQRSEEKLAAKARRDAARAEIADRCGDSTEDDNAIVMPAKAYHTVVAHDAIPSHHSSLLVFWPRL
jgi:hypothetical protein